MSSLRVRKKFNQNCVTLRIYSPLSDLGGPTSSWRSLWSMFTISIFAHTLKTEQTEDSVRERKMKSQRTSFNTNMKHESKSEHICAHTHLATLSGHKYAWEDRMLVRLIIQSQAGVISKMCYEVVVLRETQKDRCSKRAFSRIKKSMLWVVTNKPLLSGLIQGWLLYLWGQRSIEGLLLLYKWSVLSFSQGRGQGLSTRPCTLCCKWWSE